MKDLFQLISGLVLVILLVIGCRSKSLLNKSTSKLKLDHETISTSSEESIANSSTLFARQYSDSSGFDYQVTIFPLDTFWFSPDGGFVGMAEQVRINGRSTQLIRIKDSLSGTSKSVKRMEMQTASTTEILRKEEDKVKQKEGSMKGFTPLIVLTVFISGILIYWNVRRRG